MNDQEVENPASTPAVGLWKMQQDYAWEWFKYHAKQRTDMFNYFLIVTGLLITGYVNLRKDNHLVLSGLVSLVGLCTSIGFFLLDCRNKQLVDNASSILAVVEENSLFCDAPFKGMGLCHGDADKSKIWFRHKTVFRGAQILIGLLWLGFIIATVHSWWLVKSQTLNINSARIPSAPTQFLGKAKASKVKSF